MKKKTKTWMPNYKLGHFRYTICKELDTEPLIQFLEAGVFLSAIIIRCVIWTSFYKVTSFRQLDPKSQTVTYAY